MSTGLLFDPRFLDHDPGAHHPERSARLVSARRALMDAPWYPELLAVEPRVADRKWLETTHDSAYIERAAEACRTGLPWLDVADVGISSQSYDIALHAAGGAMALADAVVGGDLGNGFALLRPPGHHAERDLALGFCLFNNVAIVARYLQQAHGLDKILILDWDVHHGNGTQHTFEEDPSVLYVSLHQYPHYPGTGAATETGSGRGAGATLNCPMPAGAGDADYQRAFSERVLPAIDEFAPELVLLSAGFDAHVDDPLAEVEVSTEGFRWMSERMVEVADRHAGGRLVSLLEGGYDLDALGASVTAHVGVLAAAARE